MGHWVVVGGVSYFVPQTYITGTEPEWMPYQHGYWAWVSATGWTWISYDPWGWVTEHYGIWRHHRIFGWIWMPFKDRHYVPHCVSWFNAGDYLGWYPYCNTTSALYLQFRRVGFDDGFWAGPRLITFYGRPNFLYRPGFVIVHKQDVTAVNIVSVAIFNTLSIHPVLITAEQIRTREFLERGALRPAPETAISLLHTKGGAEIMMAKSVNPVPRESAEFLHHLNELKDSRHIPLGSVIRAQNGEFTLVKPAGRATAPKPIQSGKGQKTQEPPGQTKVNPKNPRRQQPRPRQPKPNQGSADKQESPRKRPSPPSRSNSNSPKDSRSDGQRRNTLVSKSKEQEQN